MPRGRTLGVTQQLPEKDKYIYSREYLLDRLTVMLAGRAAKQEFMESETSGSENDLKEATRLARRMVLEWGMSRRLGFAAWGGTQEHVVLGEDIARRREYGEATARQVDEEVKTILEDCHRRAVDVLREHAGALHELALRLTEKEELPGTVVRDLLRRDAAAPGRGRELAGVPTGRPTDH